MKTLLSIISVVAVLAGCATAPPRSYNHVQQMPPPSDPSQWHVVSVTPVAPGTAERLAASSGKGAPEPGSSVLYSTETVVTAQPVYVQQPVYVPQPVYVQQAPYYAPAPAYYYPPVSIGLDFVFGRSWGGHGHHCCGSGVGIGIGTRWRH